MWVWLAPLEKENVLMPLLFLPNLSLDLYKHILIIIIMSFIIFNFLKDILLLSFLF